MLYPAELRAHYEMKYLATRQAVQALFRGLAGREPFAMPALAQAALQPGGLPARSRLKLKDYCRGMELDGPAGVYVGYESGALINQRGNMMSQLAGLGIRSERT